ncbi:uncharacterized protein GIQ15_06005 [Arthroderma uncinatum]|uniref:uncharacterized protein n=1 Tax=Arthroderma uncinatum TaxID=74035 RepID=UPI00144AF249|nr:uncharacterized protein GIQ15_06005 [Arthroderma uncinatum]KAF3480658.1 hypothetical protein GIQ15_06005 [Arthroderma uncinatum]
MMAANNTSKGVDAWINYYKPPADGSLPQHNDLEIMLGDKDMVSYRMRIHDLRGKENDFTLDTHGLQYAKLQTKVTDWANEDEIKSTYFPEVEELVKRVTGASQVLVYNHTVRNAAANDYGDHVKGIQGVTGPARRIHVDQTPEGAASTVAFMFPEQVDDFTKRGYQLLNVWRPLTRVCRDPLMVADMLKMPESDLVVVPRSYYNGMKSWNYAVKYNGSEAANNAEAIVDGKSSGGEHSWWYIGDQEADEAMIFSCSDLRPGKRANGAVHGSFCLPDQEKFPARQSIEVRVVAVY